MLAAVSAELILNNQLILLKHPDCFPNWHNPCSWIGGKGKTARGEHHELGKNRTIYNLGCRGLRRTALSIDFKDAHRRASMSTDKCRTEKSAKNGRQRAEEIKEHIHQARKAANRVKELRQSLLMSKAELARRADLSELTITRVELGEPCREETRRKILRGLGISLSEKHEIFPDG
jgi:ribosome-binding protein aMBF1 (putative translation factor)